MTLPMTPLDRYLKTLKTYLPRDQQDDIARELSENLRSQMEDREAELGRPLTEAEQKAILERHGDPLTVAGAYQRDQRSLAFGRELVGPVLFPLYLRVLRINLGVTFLVCLPIFLALRGPANILSAVPAIFLQLLLQFGIVTLIFSLAQHHMAKVPEGGGKQPAAKPSVPAGSRVPRLESFAELVALAVFLGWILAAGSSPGWVSGYETDAVTLGPVWKALFLPTVLVTLLAAARAVVNLFRPEWTGLRAVGRVVLGVAWLVIFGYLAMAGDWIVPVQTAAPVTAETLRRVDLVNRWFFFYPLLVTVAFTAVHLVLQVRKLLQHRRRALLCVACLSLLAVAEAGASFTSTPALGLPPKHSATAPTPA